MEIGVPFSVETNPTTIGTLPELQLTNIEHVEIYHLNNNFVANLQSTHSSRFSQFHWTPVRKFNSCVECINGQSSYFI